MTSCHLLAGTSEEWSYLYRDSRIRKVLRDPLTMMLFECCNETLRKGLTRTFGVLATTDKQTFIRKSQAVRQENMVAHVQLQHVFQNRDVPIRAFAAHL